MKYTMSAAELLQKEYPKQEKIMGDWLTSRSLSMVYSWRGLGKSMFCMSLAYCIAGGQPFLGWKSLRPRKVLYIDGELGGQLLQKRFTNLVDSFDFDVADDAISVTSLENHGGIIPNLGHPIEREVYGEMMADYEVVFIDNLSACVRSVPKQDKLTTWLGVRDWLLRQRDQNKAIIYVHHAGKNGSQRWFSDVEDPLDISIRLSKAPTWSANTFPKLLLEFEKTRDWVGVDAAPKYIELERLDDGKTNWKWTRHEAITPSFGEEDSW